MYGKMQASGLTEFIPFTCTSALWGQILVHLKEEGQMWQMAASCIPHPSSPPSPSSSAITVEDGSIWITGTVFHFGSPHSHLEAGNR